MAKVRAAGQWAIGPSGVAVQSCLRIPSAIAPLQKGQESDSLSSTRGASMIPLGDAGANSNIDVLPRYLILVGVQMSANVIEMKIVRIEQRRSL
ncbi:hypothetical protein GCM10007887_07480 [Methylobacterium haplocladii]|uniref:Uncharacterized protein n=1 Tax=Methylobacterium haplocladii TaxID=1176176 RepID=A0A512IMN9_9HYPH|nr:hypothetical protein MHA02_13060 [Methylobacterium haplocladii]GLS58092.1 hypothetical protein GCM10007887_07480 [Methylobacterium haplocladii]